MVTIPARARLFIFIAGLALIAFGGFGLVTGAPWGAVANSLFTIFGTTASFAQFSIGFSSLKPANGSAAKAQPSPRPNTSPSGYPNPGLPQAYLPYPPSSPADRTATAILTGPSGQINLGSTQLTIGRAPDNQHVVNDSQASGHHAIIRPEGQGYTITDLGSTNGTYVNGQRLAARVPHSLSPGDTIRIGTTMFTYEVNTAPEIAKTVYAPEPLRPPPPQRYTPPQANQPYLPPQAYQPYAPPPGSTSIPVWGTQKTYRGSGIALLLASVCTIIYMLLFLSAPIPTENQAILQFEIFGLVGIFILSALPGFYAKQAHKVGWLGTIGTMMLAAGWILNILISCIFVVNATSNQPFSPEAVSSILTLYHVNYFFIIIGDIILGISIIRVGVYPRWTGIANIVLGCLNLIYALVPLATAVEVVAALLAAAILSQWGLTLMKRSPNYPQQYRNL
jgi:pSer/pThr/pTyr-binding forkhead associated (FHA) protein